MNDCLFCRLVKGEIPSNKVYEDDELLAFRDIRPQAPLHVLIIPKRHIESLSQTQDDDIPLLGRMLALAPEIAAEQGSHGGFRTVINTGRVGGQEVYHLHIHVLGGDKTLPAMLKY